ncbi:hypothetical protein ACFT7S_21850 [Streptomyces sp. NPDC057136]|uniref:hypothetical protein n=1 Tax=Streptomyces sp. NPDC057136 TaxID=3346029 RepID=UPI0036285972
MERKRSATFGQWLLFVALLFGIATMHTVGHPAEHPPPGASATAAHRGHEAPEPVPAASSALPHASPARDAADAAPMSGMDPMAVCLAVLSTWAVALLALRLVGPRRAGPLSGRMAGVRLPRLPRPDPPPRKAVLATLSVLRI